VVSMETMNKTKLCRDCHSFAKCAHPLQINPGIGTPKDYCSIERMPEYDGITKCGYSGKGFLSPNERIGAIKTPVPDYRRAGQN
jgi:hypothetical protein